MDPSSAELAVAEVERMKADEQLALQLQEDDEATVRSAVAAAPPVPDLESDIEFARRLQAEEEEASRPGGDDGDDADVILPPELARELAEREKADEDFALKMQQDEEAAQRAERARRAVAELQDARLAATMASDADSATVTPGGSGDAAATGSPTVGALRTGRRASPPHASAAAGRPRDLAPLPSSGSASPLSWPPVARVAPPSPPVTPELTRAEVARMTTDEIKLRLMSLGLPASGAPHQVAARLMDAMCSADDTSEPPHPARSGRRPPSPPAGGALAVCRSRGGASSPGGDGRASSGVPSPPRRPGGGAARPPPPVAPPEGDGWTDHMRHRRHRAPDAVDDDDALLSSGAAALPGRRVPSPPTVASPDTPPVFGLRRPPRDGPFERFPIDPSLARNIWAQAKSTICPSSCSAPPSTASPRIVAVWNPALWTKYTSYRDGVRAVSRGCKLVQPVKFFLSELRDTMMSTNNEMLLFHGTCSSRLTTILSQGLDFRLAAAGLYGAGTYFARQMCKSMQYMKGRNTLLVCLVTLGYSHVCKSGAAYTTLKRPPPDDKGVIPDSITAEPGVRVAGATGGDQVHWEHIVFDKNACYPAFVIEW